MRKLTFGESQGEIWFMPFRFDGTVEDHHGPGGVLPQPKNGGLTKAEQLAVDRLLATAADSDSTVTLPDGGSADVEVQRGRLMLRPRRVRPALAKLVYDLLAAGRWTFTADDVLVVTNAKYAARPPRDSRVPADWYLTVPAETLVVESPAELATALGWDASHD